MKGFGFIEPEEGKDQQPVASSQADFQTPVDCPQGSGVDTAGHQVSLAHCKVNCSIRDECDAWQAVDAEVQQTTQGEQEKMRF